MHPKKYLINFSADVLLNISVWENVRYQFYFFFSEGEQAQSGRSETQYIILFNFQRGCNELCLVSSNSLQKSRSNCLIFQIGFGFHVNYQILSLRTVASIV